MVSVFIIKYADTFCYNYVAPPGPNIQIIVPVMCWGTTAGSCNSSDSYHSTTGHCEEAKQKRLNGESECSCKALN